MASAIQLRSLYIVERRSIPDIGTLFNMPLSRARQQLLAAGVVLRCRGDGIRLAAYKIGDAHRGRARVFTPEWCQHISEGKLAHGEKYACGVSLKPNGYLEITRGPNKGKNLHRALLEQRLGRLLRRDEVVHHVDENKLNNDINNLAVMSRSAHTSLHRRNRKGT